MVKTKDGELELIVPRDREGIFQPQIVKKHQNDISPIEDKVITLYGCGISTRDISDLKTIYTSPNAEIGLQNLEEFAKNGIKLILIFRRVVEIIGNNFQLFGVILKRFAV